jgi:hypothetical protein
MKNIEVGTFEDDEGLWHIELREDGQTIGTYDEAFDTREEAEEKARELVSELGRMVDGDG